MKWENIGLVRWMMALWLLGNCTGALGQTEEPDSIRLSESFMKALQGAFEMTPRTDTIRYKEEFLTREQLHEWVGDVDDTHDAPHPKDTTLYLDPRFLGLKPAQAPVSIMFPDFGKEVNIWKSKHGNYRIVNLPGGRTAATGLDVKKSLSELLIPKYRKIRKARQIAEKGKASMDAAFPIWKE